MLRHFGKPVGKRMKRPIHSPLLFLLFSAHAFLCNLRLATGQTCDPGYGILSSEGFEGILPKDEKIISGCAPCEKGTKSEGNKCNFCEKDTYQACTKQVTCLSCPGGTSTTGEGVNKKCETDIDTNDAEYKRQFTLSQLKDGELCGGVDCSDGICASFDTTMRCELGEKGECILTNYNAEKDDTDSDTDEQTCPMFYMLAWSEIENIVVMNAVDTDEEKDLSVLQFLESHWKNKCEPGVPDSTCAATKVFRENNADGQLIFFVGIPTKGCGVKDRSQFSPGETVIENQPPSEYCIKNTEMPQNKSAADSVIKMVSLEAVIKKRTRLLRGEQFEYKPIWKTAAGDKETRCEEGMYLNNTNRDLSRWKCDACPPGAHCTQQVNGETAPLVWTDVRAKFGWFRLDPYDSNKVGHTNWPDDFEECANPLSCLGESNPPLERQYRDVASLLADRPFNEDGTLKNVLGVLNRTARQEICNSGDDGKFKDKDFYTSFGYRQSCGPGSSANGTADEEGKTTRCLLCRACKFGYFPSGMRNCMPCPPAHFQVIGAFAAIGFLVATLYVFLKAALDTDSSPHSHLAQPLQKIVLNHLQLISLASSFPLKWPKVITDMFDAFGMIARAGSFIFQPQCTRTEAQDQEAAGTSTFFQKQLLVLFLPAMALFASIVFWTVYEAKGFRKWWEGLKAEREEKRKIKPMTSAELFNRFHLFAIEDHKHDKDHKHRNRHKAHAHHDRLSHHGVHDLLFALCHDDRHPGLKKFLASKKKFDAVFNDMDPAEDDGKVEFHSLLTWYNERAKELMEAVEKREKKTHAGHEKTNESAHQEEEMHDMAIHIANEALDLHKTLSQPVKLGEATTIIRVKDNGSSGQCHLRDLSLTLPFHPKSNRDAQGNLKKSKKKKKKQKTKSAVGLTEPGGLHCELRYSEVWGHGMELQQLTDSTVDVMVDGSLLIPGDMVELGSKSLIVIGDTEILCDIVKHDMYRNFHRPAHLVSKESRIKDERAAVHAPTREELQDFFMNARSHRKKNVDEAGLTRSEFHSILKQQPEIFGHMWAKAQVTTCYNNMRDHVKDNAAAVVQRRSSKKANTNKAGDGGTTGETKKSSEDEEEDDGDGDSEGKMKKGRLPAPATKHDEPGDKAAASKKKNIPRTRIPANSESHFLAFEEFAFHYFMERRHHTRKLQWARERHDARRRTVTVDDRVMKADAVRRMGYFDKVVATVITIIYLLYPTLCGAAFSMVACKQIGKSHTYLVQDLQVECFAPNGAHTYWFVFLCLPALITLVAGIPGIASYMLWRSRHNLHRRHIRFRFSILFIGYEDRAFFWEIVVAVRKLTVSAISVFLLQVDTPTQVLTAEIFVVGVLVLHLHVAPYIHVTPNHDTLQNAETFALSVSFLTLVFGMLMFENSLGGSIKNEAAQSALTFAVISINAAFIFAAFYWWLTLKLMDLENVLEHKTTRQRAITCCAMFLKRVVPDWEKEGQELEIKREQAEAVDDLRHTNFDKLLRVQKVAHSLVENFRARKLRSKDPTKVIPVANNGGDMASIAAKMSRKTLDQMAASVEEKSEQAAKKFLAQMEGRVAKAHERLEARKRRRSTIADPSIKMFVVPKGVGLGDLGFKLKVATGDVIVYSMEFDTAAYRVGVRDGYKLIRAADEPVDTKTIISVLKSSPRPLKLVFKVKKEAVRRLRAAVRAVEVGGMI
jgi:hypothetical protein